MEMEMDYVTEFPHIHMDRRPMKRPRLAWGFNQPQQKAQSWVYNGQDVGNLTSFGPSRAHPDHTSLFEKGLDQTVSPPWRDDDKDGHYMFALGENLTSRYKIYRKVGEGTFGQVLECWDRETKEMVAIKPENVLFVSPEYVKIPDEVMTCSAIRETCYSRLPKSNAIKVIDLGSAAYEHQDHNYIVSTRHYRAPEVILGLGWSYPCDMWSVGCILVELCSGEALFQTHENLEHLAMMERVLGPLPQHMLKTADRHAEKYVKKGKLDWPAAATSTESIKAVLIVPANSAC
ncbi:Serine/threonine-protein kinase AFC2 [Hibiscus syriacus]|uniref:Serine/threonine-protein kinase AFC2 n=1 Tax=Hibiscus syriacus TaxID=106335 RepID=A0A6A2Z8M0_HIBSY|nr:Serine/threonine-protein kinase AFC2 [Hibiscus syriacus]